MHKFNSNTQSTTGNTSNTSNTSINQSEGENTMTTTSQYEQVKSSLNNMFVNMNTLAAPTEEERAVIREERAAERAERGAPDTWKLGWTVEKIVNQSFNIMADAISTGTVEFIQKGIGFDQYRNNGNTILVSNKPDREAQFEMLGKALALKAIDIYELTQGEPGSVYLTHRHNNGKMQLVFATHEYKGKTYAHVNTFSVVQKSITMFGKTVVSEERGKMNERQLELRKKAFEYNQLKQESSDAKNPYAPYKYEMLATMLSGGKIGIYDQQFKEVGMGYLRESLSQWMLWGILVELAYRSGNTVKNENGKDIPSPEFEKAIGQSPETARALRKAARQAQGK